MDNSQNTKTNPQNKNRASGSFVYEIKVQGHLDQVWSKWFEEMTLTLIQNGECGEACTLITGPVTDQPALHGLLTKIGNLNLTLISVRRMDPEKGTLEEIPIDPATSGDQNRR